MAELKADLTPSERAVDLVESLRSGKLWTTADVASRYGITRRGALGLLHRVSRIAPIAFDGWRWRYVGSNLVRMERALPGCVVE